MWTVILIVIILLLLTEIFALLTVCRRGHSYWTLLRKYRYAHRGLHDMLSWFGAYTGDPADEVDGMVFRITAAELAAADSYEVSDYRRIAVTLKSGRKAFVYIRAADA